MHHALCSLFPTLLACIPAASLTHSFLSHYPACLCPIHFRFISYTTFSPLLPVHFCRFSKSSLINHHVLCPLPIMPAAPVSPLFIPLSLAHSFRAITLPVLSSYYIIHNFAFGLFLLAIYPLNLSPFILNYYHFYLCSIYFCPLPIRLLLH